MKKNYLIVMPVLTESFSDSYYFPIGMAYVSSSLKQSGRNVTTYNLNYKHGSVEENLRNIISSNNIDVIFTGGLTAHYWRIREILEAARRIKPNIITGVGGGIITSDPINAMKALEIADYGMSGEGEETICELASALEGERTLDSVNGLVFFQDDKVVVNPPREEVSDLDALPYPDYDGFSYEELLDKHTLYVFASDQGRLGYVSFGRSCPFRCTFCFHPSGTKYRRRSMDSIFSEIDYLIDRFHIEALVVSDELFCSKMDVLKEFCKRIKERHLTFTISLRVDLVNREMIEILKNSGCVSIGFGLESADNRILTSMKKHTTVEQIEAALTMCEEVGIHFSGNFIFGDQAETKETYTNTLRWWKEHPQFRIHLQLITVYPGSELYHIALERGIIKDPVQFIKDGCPYINLTQMSDQEYKDMALEISMLRQRRKGSLKDGKATYSGNGKANLSGYCSECGEYNSWSSLDVFRSSGMLFCKSCNKSHNINVCDYISTTTVEENLKKVLPRKAAIWPVVDAVAEFCNCISADLWSNMYFIDHSAMKQGANFMGNTVYGGDIIEKANIEIVFVSVTSLVSLDIIEEIKVKHPSVKKIFYLGDLIDKSFSLESN